MLTFAQRPAYLICLVVLAAYAPLVHGKRDNKNGTHGMECLVRRRAGGTMVSNMTNMDIPAVIMGNRREFSPALSALQGQLSREFTVINAHRTKTTQILTPKRKSMRLKKTCDWKENCHDIMTILTFKPQQY